MDLPWVYARPPRVEPQLRAELPALQFTTKRRSEGNALDARNSDINERQFGVAARACLIKLAATVTALRATLIRPGGAAAAQRCIKASRARSSRLFFYFGLVAGLSGYKSPTVLTSSTMAQYAYDCCI